jgi:hypothetical protein
MGEKGIMIRWDEIGIVPEPTADFRGRIAVRYKKKEVLSLTAAVVPETNWLPIACLECPKTVDFLLI